MKLEFPRNAVLAVFMLGTFAVGMTEYVVTGLLTQFAEGLNVEVSTTGVLLSVYAISVAVFGPLLRMVTIKYSPKPLLLVFIGIFIISNIMAAAAPTFEVLILSRLFSAAMHAPFFGLCMSLAVQMSAPQKRTQAIAAVQGGLTIAIMLGVPFGSFLGGILDWRLVFWFIALLGVLTFTGLAIVTPNIKPSSTPQLKKELAGMLKNKSALMVIAIIVFGFSGVFTAYTFTEPMLREFAGFGVTGITTGLFFFGLGAVAGNFASGRIHPARLTERLIVFLAVLGAIVALFTFLLEFSVLAFVMCFLFGAGTFGTTPILNSKIIIASPDSPSMSGTVAASVFNLANSIGATLGTVFLHASYSYAIITFFAAGIIFFGMVLTVVTHLVEDKTLFQQSADQ
ncbi:MFS transporter [Salibacterium qingdaonense]|uniref:Predicted arabinose efflux permease, MFS family n=1 Tax=Salibacterium qingdaonense TaxID=266892 RepID=A0A1I4MM04_9BACI|nr:MFS transporter [Salibacterium qingdaonense]SFM04304.1 Predicted arabinose efflux permease, MFS family [Salibacterium qingdaonense]